jgi:hypothetical protein
MAMENDPELYNEILACDKIAKHEGKTIYQVIWEIQSSIKTQV